MNKIIEKSRKKYIRAMDQYQAVYRFYKEAEKTYNEKKRPEWIKFLVQPIADYIAEAMPEANVEVGGPLGLSARAYIWVEIEKDGVEYMSGVTLDPADLDNGIVKVVDFSTQEHAYPKNSIGEINALGYALDPLPDDLDDLVKDIKAKFSPSGRM